MKWKITEKEANLRLIEFLQQKNIPKKIWTLIKADSRLIINGEKRSPGERLSQGETINLSEYYPKPATTTHTLDILYETDEFLIVNKSSGMLIHPTGLSLNEVTLNDLVLNYFYEKSIPSLAHPVIRLDRNTSGLALYAKKPAFQKFFQESPAEKIYLAVSQNAFYNSSFLLSAPIKRADNSIIEREVGRQGKTALTEISLLATDKGFSLFQCKIHTGRTHQIRLHLASIGLTIYGDDLYGQKSELSPSYALHAWKLSLPQTSKNTHPLLITCPPPNYIKELFPGFSF